MGNTPDLQNFDKLTKIYFSIGLSPYLKIILYKTSSADNGTSHAMGLTPVNLVFDKACPDHIKSSLSGCTYILPLPFGNPR